MPKKTKAKPRKIVPDNVFGFTDADLKLVGQELRKACKKPDGICPQALKALQQKEALIAKVISNPQYWTNEAEIAEHLEAAKPDPPKPGRPRKEPAVLDPQTSDELQGHVGGLQLVG